ncbi:hypothetical protein AVEN_224717-1 [Araneus ventricosus]|uniref:Uncharacterized protein n=1 Tax=Araneus ventricosus TaxID=182803 RepID=A0A4Y2U0Z7_ARAVE|nr:hypothetical protein AVEN_224717-1 [Araneus ventricosus]
MRLGYQPIDTPGTEMYHPSNGMPRTANTWGFWLSMRSKKQTEWQQPLMESSLACRRGMEGISRKQKAKGRVNWKGVEIPGYLGIGTPVPT